MQISEEKPKVHKDNLVLLNDHYKNPNTSLLIFRFEPQPFIATQNRLQGSQIKYASIEGKDLYLIDQFFQEDEGKEMQTFSKTAPFSRNSYGSPEAIERGEKPARSMNGKERWQFFSQPPAAINELYKLFGLFAHKLNADITTLPWELCDPSAHGSPAVIANKLEEATRESMDLGKHQDCNPEGNVPCGIPVLYDPGELHPAQFINGAPGKPWLISVMVYTTDEEFRPEYCLGTAFYQKDGKLVVKANCLNMRIVIFEGDIFHSIEESNIPDEVKTWRISYVFKLIVNPKEENQNVKAAFLEMARNAAPQIEILSLGPDSRG